MEVISEQIKTITFPMNKPKKVHKDMADRIIDGFVTLSSHHKEVFIGLVPDWKSNPTNDSNWWFIFHSLRWIESLINAYFLTKDSDYLLHARSIIISWITHNPYEKMKVAPWNDHASSYRLRFFAWFWKVYSNSELYLENAEFNEILKDSVDVHMNYHMEPSNYNMRSNHALEMVSALISASNIFKAEFPYTSQALDYALIQLDKYVEINFSTNGYHLEQSPGYHIYVLERLSSIYGYMNEYNHPSLKKIWHAFYMLTNGDSFPTIGDTGELNLIEILARFEENGNTVYEQQKIFVDVCEYSGYFIVKNEIMHSVFRCNNFVGSHYHNDYMSFTYKYKGVNWFIDPGYYTYSSHNTFFEYFRSGYAHSGLVVNGTPITAKDKKEINEYSLSEKKIKVTRFIDEGSHSRTFQVVDNQIFIKDEFYFSQESSVELLFQIHPDVETCIQHDRIRLRYRKDYVDLLPSDCNIEWKIHKGRKTPISGWYSKKYNEIEPCTTIIAKANGAIFDLEFIISPGNEQ